MNCPFCNQNLPEGAVFCGFCGNKLADAAQAPSAAQPVDAEAAAENAAQNIESSVSAVTDNAAAPEVASATAVGTAENVIPDMPDTVQNVSAVDLSKNVSASAPEGTSAPENNIVGQVRDGVQNVASSVQNDTQEAVAAVKNGNFKALLKNKTFLICCAAIIVVILLIVIIAVCAAAASGSDYKVKGAYYRVEDGDDAVYLYNGTVVKGVDMTDASYILAASLDGTAAVVGDGEELYLFRETKAARITDDFDTSSASISANGNTVSYVSDDSVFIYTGGKSRKIADLEDDYYCHPVISPNGKTVAFSDKDDDIKTYVWKGGSKAIDLDSDIIPISVSDGGKMIFGADESGKLCYIKNMKKNGVEKIDSTSGIKGISLDHTKLLYVSDGATYCFDTSLDNEDGVRITRGIIDPITDFSYQGSIQYINDFKRFYGKENGNLYKYFRKGKDYDDEKLVSDIKNPIFSKDNKSFVYIDEGDVMKGTLSNAKNAKRVAKDAVSVRTNDSVTNIFYCDEDMTLRYAVKGKKIASDVKRYVVTNSGVCVFSDIDGDLFYSSKGGEKKKAGLDEISSLEIRNNVLYVVSDGELYTSTNGKSFKKAGVDVG